MEGASTGPTRRIAGFVAKTNAADIPPVEREHAKVAFLDWFGVLMAGKDEPLVHALIRFADSMGGEPQATILGHGRKTNASQAALINGSASHALDYDDSMAVFMGHPSVTLFPGLVALAEWRALGGRDLLDAYVIGLKAASTIAACAGPEHYAAGWHGTSTIGRLASASACARLLGLDEGQTVHALGIAGTQAGGLKRVFGTMCKPFHAGRAAQVGLEAAMLAREGFTSAEDILEGPDGFFDLLKGSVNEQALSTLGKSWPTDALAQKYHASCHGTHSAIEAVLRLVRDKGLAPGEIASIRIHASQMALNIAGRRHPTTALEGKFSLWYCVANAVMRGNTGMQAFTDEKVNDPEIQRFMERISVVQDEKIQALEAEVDLETTTGRTYHGFSDVLNEIPDLATKKQKVSEKFLDLCLPALGQARAAGLMETFMALEKVSDMRELIEEVSA